MIESGCTNSGGTIASVLVGHRDTSSLRDLPKLMLSSAGYMYAIIYVIIFVFAKPLALLFGAEEANLALYVAVIRIYNLWLLISPISSPVRCIYQAMGKIRLINIISVIGSCILPVLYDVCVGEAVGLYAVVMIATMTEVFAVLIFLVTFIIFARRLPRGIHDLCYIPDTVSAPRENRFKATIETLSDVTAASEQIVDFCKSKGMSDKMAYYCGLCVEEMAADTVENRFTKHMSSIDLRAICENGSISIMLRDDCPYFDPNEWLKLCDPDDKTRSLGIRMVSKLSSEMKYVSTMGLNVLNIVLKND